MFINTVKADAFGFMQVFGEGGSEEQVKGQCTKLLKLKTVGDHLSFLKALLSQKRILARSKTMSG